MYLLACHGFRLLLQTQALRYLRGLGENFLDLACRQVRPIYRILQHLSLLSLWNHLAGSAELVYPQRLRALSLE